jgi:hypothetical protein
VRAHPVIRGIVVAAVTITALAVSSAPAQAAAITYTLSATNGMNWSSAPWSGGQPPETPGPGDTATVRIFNATSPHTAITTTMDIPGLTIDKLEFQGADIKIAGSALGLRSLAPAGAVSDVLTSGLSGNELALPLNVSGRAAVSSTSSFLTFSGTTTVSAGSILAFYGHENDSVGSTITGTLGGGGTKGVASGIVQLNNNVSNTAVTAWGRPERCRFCASAGIPR